MAKWQSLWDFYGGREWDEYFNGGIERKMGEKEYYNGKRWRWDVGGGFFNEEWWWKPDFGGRKQAKMREGRILWW